MTLEKMPSQEILDAVVELQTKIKELEQELEDIKKKDVWVILALNEKLKQELERYKELVKNLKALKLESNWFFQDRSKLFKEFGD